MSKTLFLCGTTHGQQLPTFRGADKFRKALLLLLANSVKAVLEEWDQYGGIVLKSSAQAICEMQGIYWERLGLPNDSPTFGDTLFDPPLPPELDTVRLIPPIETLAAFGAGRTPDAGAWEGGAAQNSTVVVGRYR